MIFLVVWDDRRNTAVTKGGVVVNMTISLSYADETVKVADHDFSKVSIFPNAVLILICPYAEYQFNNNIDLEDEDSFTVIILPCFF